ncbi:MAG: VOC family protein [Granulosicoccus sp.]|nr:VOC family protein [Granulosicoccus sp.]
MKHSLMYVALLVRDYDEALDYYIGKLNFTLHEDTYIESQDKRWVVVTPGGSSGTSIVLARAADSQQMKWVGNQAAGRVFLFLQTDDLIKDYKSLCKSGVEFVREPETFSYGKVAVFKDLYGNLWDLIESVPKNCG